MITATLNAILLILIGLVTGSLTGFTGASGVLIVVPLINIFLGFSIHESIGTSLMVDVIASIAVSYTYYRHGNTDLKHGIWVALGSIIGAQFGAFYVVRIPGPLLGLSFGLGLVIMGIMLMVRKKGQDEDRLRRIRFRSEWMRIVAAVLLGFVLGLMTGFFGAGGGFSIFLVLYFILEFPIKKAVGTSTLIMIITALSGAVGYGLNGNIRVGPGLLVGISAVVGGIISAGLANRADERQLTVVVSGLFIILGIAMITIRLVQGNILAH